MCVRAVATIATWLVEPADCVGSASAQSKDIRRIGKCPTIYEPNQVWWLGRIERIDATTIDTDQQHTVCRSISGTDRAFQRDKQDAHCKSRFRHETPDKLLN